VAWNLSNTLDADFCIQALEEALGEGRPEVFSGGSAQSGEHTAKEGDTKVLMGSTLVTFGKTRTYRDH
jgi:hypothetical protein